VSVLIILNDAKQIPLDRGKLNSDLVLAKIPAIDALEDIKLVSKFLAQKKGQGN